MVRKLLEGSAVMEIVEELYRPLGWIIKCLLVERRRALGNRVVQLIGGVVVPSLIGDRAALVSD